MDSHTAVFANALSFCLTAFNRVLPSERVYRSPENWRKNTFSGVCWIRGSWANLLLLVLEERNCNLCYSGMSALLLLMALLVFMLRTAVILR